MKYVFNVNSKEKKISSLAPHEIFFIIKRESLMKELYSLFIIQSPIKAMNNTIKANIPNRNVAIKPKKNLIPPSIISKFRLSVFMIFVLVG